jgi:hypothetical protein
VTIDWFWINNRIYWTPCYTARDYTFPVAQTHTSVHSNVFTSRCSVAAFNGGRSPSSGFLNSARHQLPASDRTAHINWAPVATWLTHSPTNNSSLRWLTEWTTVKVKVKVKVKLTFRLAVYRQSVRLGVKPLETFFQLNACGNIPYVTSSLTRKWVYLSCVCLVFRQGYALHI